MPKKIKMDEDDMAYEAAHPDIDPHDKPRCVTGKVIIETESKAASIAKNMRRYHSNPFIHQYFCRDCGFFHTGHIPGTLRKTQDVLDDLKGK